MQSTNMQQDNKNNVQFVNNSEFITKFNLFKNEKINVVIFKLNDFQQFYYF